MADILSIGSSGLSAYRRSLEVTGNNIVNANTAGYLRRDTVLAGQVETAQTPVSIANGSGGGVKVDVVRRASDDFVQSEARIASANASEAQSLSDRLNQLQQNLFAGSSDLGSSVQDFFNKLQDFATSPTSIPARVSALQAADAAAGAFRTQANALTTQSDAVVSDATGELQQVNSLTKQLARINTGLESLGGDPSKINDLLDQRDKVVDQIVKSVGATVETRESGAVNLYLGAGTGGPQLVGPSGAKDLTVERMGTKINLTMDPYGSPVPIGKLSGGTVQGIVAFDDQISSSLDQLNRLAVGLTSAVNRQHMQGVDLNGNRGLPLFSTDSLGVSASKANIGNASASLDVTNAGSLSTTGYTAHYNAAVDSWTVTNNDTLAKVTAAKISGQDVATIDGVKVSFSGVAKDGDLLNFAPLANAASGVRLLIQDPNQLAAGLTQLAQAGTGNTGSGAITLDSAGGMVAAPTVPALASIFTHALSPDAALGIKRDGAVTAIPAGATGVTLHSLSTLSAANFQFDPTQLSATPPTQLVVSVDGSGQTISLPLGPIPLPPASGTSANAMAVLADTVNTALAHANPPLSNTIFASISNGALTLNALGTHTVNAASLTNGDGSFKSQVAYETPSSAADIELLTTEGRQISGAALAPADLQRLMTPANGFSSEAVYSPPAANTGYRGISVKTSTAPLTQTTVANANGSHTATVTVNAVPETDSAWQSKDGTRHAGAVYSLAVAGLPTIRLAGDAVAGKGSADIAAAFAAKLTSNLPTRTITGAAITLPSDGPASTSFSIAIDDTTSTVTFNRSVNADGTLAPGGSFTVAGNPALKVSLADTVPSTTPPTARLVIQLPPNASSKAPTVSIAGGDTLGLQAGVTQRLIANAPPSQTLSYPQTLALTKGGTPLSLDVTSPSGTDPGSGISWSQTSDGRFMLESPLSSPELAFATTTTTAGAAATALGFEGTDLSVTASGATLHITSSITDTPAAPLLADTSGSVSRLGQTVTVDGPLPEDLIVAVKGQPGGQRQLLATYPPTMTRANPTMPDVEVRITSPNSLDIIDKATGTSLATRRFASGQPVSYLGATFHIDGDSAVGDAFDITTDPARTGDNRNGLKIAALANSNLFGAGSGTFQAIYSNEVGKIGSTAQAAQTAATTTKSVSDSLAAAFDSATGVNLDTEAANLIQMQQAYQACAQIISTAREMFDTILKSL